jgi:hypothetical protein
VPNESNLNPPTRPPGNTRRRGRRGGQGRRREPRPLPANALGDAPKEIAPVKNEISSESSLAETQNAEPLPEKISPTAAESVSEISREREPQLRRPKTFSRREDFRPAEISAINQAVKHATEIVGALQQSLDEMEEILELIELAERQKIADEREIEELRRALRRLQPPRQLLSSRAPRREESSRSYQPPANRPPEEPPAQSGGEDFQENQNPEE